MKFTCGECKPEDPCILLFNEMGSVTPPNVCPFGGGGRCIPLWIPEDKEETTSGLMEAK